MQAIDHFSLLHTQGLLKDALSVNIVLNAKNYPMMVETVLYFYIQKNIKDIRINFIWLNEDTRENWEDLKLQYTDFLPLLKKLVFISLKHHIRITFDTVPACILYHVDPLHSQKLIKIFLGEDYDHITEIDHINGGDMFDRKKRKKDLLKTQFDSCETCMYKEPCQ